MSDTAEPTGAGTIVGPANPRTYPMPKRMAARPRDARGYPITFVTFVDAATGRPDFRIIDHLRTLQAIKQKLCGLCGQPLEKRIAFIGGPESVKNRVFSDPGMHADCANYAMHVCPYLASPTATHKPHAAVEAAHPGVTLNVNPLAGVVRPDRMAIYITDQYQQILVASAPGATPVPAIRVGRPLRLTWF